MTAGSPKLKTFFRFFFTSILCILYVFPTYARYDVPEEIYFGNIRLVLSSSVRRQIQVHIRQLKDDRKEIRQNLPTLSLYLQFVEDLLVVEGLPADYKYLAFIESNLLKGTLTSSSRGFWKIGKGTIIDSEMRVDERIDERLNLVLSTEIAIHHLKRNNLHFKNWFFNMLTLELGYESAKDYVEKRYRYADVVGSQVIRLDASTHPFIRKFLACKLYLEELMGKNQTLSQRLVAYQGGANKTLAQIARRLRVNTNELKKYNPWLKKRRIPADKIYPVLIPRPRESTDNMQPFPAKNYPRPHPHSDYDSYSDRKTQSFSDMSEEELYQEIIREEAKYRKVYPDYPGRLPQSISRLVPPSERPAFHRVMPGQSLHDIARLYGISLQELREFNQLQVSDRVVPNQNLRLKPNPSLRTNAPEVSSQLHLVQVGETLFEIAKKYQVSLVDLRHWNQLEIEDQVQPGQKIIVLHETNEAINLRTSSPQSSLPPEPILPARFLQRRKLRRLSEHFQGSKKILIPRDKQAHQQHIQQQNTQPDFKR